MPIWFKFPITFGPVVWKWVRINNIWIFHPRWDVKTAPMVVDRCQKHDFIPSNRSRHNFQKNTLTSFTLWRHRCLSGSGFNRHFYFECIPYIWQKYEYIYIPSILKNGYYWYTNVKGSNPTNDTWKRLWRVLRVMQYQLSNLSSISSTPMLEN